MKLTSIAGWHLFTSHSTGRGYRRLAWGRTKGRRHFTKIYPATIRNNPRWLSYRSAETEAGIDVERGATPRQGTK